MRISSNSLIHITSKESLFKILACKGFLPNYSLEEIIFETQKIPDLRFPMVCFCDIPFHLISNHIKAYCSHNQNSKDDIAYGIGLKKEWGIKNGLNPVFYLQNKSKISINLFEKLKAIRENNNESNLQDFFDIMNIFAFIKTYEGKNQRFKENSYRYYDEREWRWVPNNLKFQYLKDEVYSNNPQKYKELLSNNLLTFDVEDIDYIIINEEKETTEIIEKLEKYFVDLIGTNKFNVLLTKIITNQKDIKNS